MEGLPFDFGAEEGSDKDPKRAAKKPKNKALGKELLGVVGLEEKTESKSKPENIGKVLIETELTRSKDTPERSSSSAKTMTHSELLNVAEKVTIDGSSLRQIYESHLVGEKGMRRIIAVFLRGGNIKRALRRELVQKEMDFERDPILRDHGAAKPIQTETNQLNSLLKKSGIDLSESEDVIPIKTQNSTNLIVINNPKQSNGSTHRRIADILLLCVILMLIAVIIVLLIK